MIPAKFYIACGCSIGFLIGAFFLVGAHHEVRYRLRERRRGGYIDRGGA